MTWLTSLRSAAAVALPLAAALPAAQAGGLPAQARIVYDVLYGSAELRIGRAEQRWRVQDGRYELQTELIPLVGPQVRYVSRGSVGAQGLVPESFAEFRGSSDTPRVQAEFDWSQRVLRYGKTGERKEAPLSPGAQDVNVLPYQLAWQGQASPSKLQVATGKKVAVYSFTPAAAAKVRLQGQALSVLPLRSVESDGDRTEVWLAPQLDHLPVRVMRMDEDKELRFVAREVLRGAAAR